jgi:phosphate:Na+ symporter
MEFLLAMLDPDPQRLVVNFHAAFNLLLAATLIWLTKPVARLAERLLPDDPKKDTRVAARHLDLAALDTPALATSNAAREVLRIGDIIESMLTGLLTVIRTNDALLARQLRRMDDDVDDLYTAIKLYLTQMGREALDERDARRWADIISFTINMEHMGDIIERMLDDLLEKKIGKRLEFSAAGMAEIGDMHARVVANLRLGMNVFLNGDLKSAQRLLATKVELRQLQQQYADTHLQRLAGQTLQSIETSSLHLDIINDFKRINSHVCSVAYPILEQAGALQPTRLREEFANGDAKQKHA